MCVYGRTTPVSVLTILACDRVLLLDAALWDKLANCWASGYPPISGSHLAIEVLGLQICYDARIYIVSGLLCQALYLLNHLSKLWLHFSSFYNKLNLSCSLWTNSDMRPKFFIWYVEVKKPWLSYKMWLKSWVSVLCWYGHDHVRDLIPPDH